MNSWAQEPGLPKALPGSPLLNTALVEDSPVENRYMQFKINKFALLSFKYYIYNIISQNSNLSASEMDYGCCASNTTFNS